LAGVNRRTYTSAASETGQMELVNGPARPRAKIPSLRQKCRRPNWYRQHPICVSALAFLLVLASALGRGDEMLDEPDAAR